MNIKIKKLISAVLICALVISFIPGLTLTASASPNSPLDGFSYRLGADGSWQETIEWKELEAGSKYYADLSIPVNAAFPITVYITFGQYGVVIYPKESPLTFRFSSASGRNSFTMRGNDGNTEYILYANYANHSDSGALSRNPCGPNLTWTFDANTGLLEINGTGQMDNWGLREIEGVEGILNAVDAPWYNHRASIRNVRISEGVTTIGSHAFSGLVNITTVNIPASVTYIGTAAFYGSGITSINIPNTVKRVVEGAFGRCSQLESVTIGAENFGADLEVLPGAFDSGRLFNSSGLDSLKHVTIQGSVKTIPGGAFGRAHALESVRIEEGVTRIGNSTFMNCISLTSVTLPNSLTRIEEYAFLSTESLKSITIPKNVTHIGSAAFREETRDIVIRGYAGSVAQTYANNEGSRWRTTFEAITGDLPDVLPGGTVTTPAPPTPTNPLDSASSWAREHITTAIAANLVPQNLQSNYTQATTRAEFAALAVAVYESVKGEITGRITFTDTSDVNVQKMAYLEVVGGVGGNRFDPSGTLTREQAAVMASRLSDAIGQPFPAQASTFADNSAASSWALEGIGRVQAAELMGGTGDNNFSPQTPYTREQSIITFLRFFERVK